jgi:excisionase family DNA binding protein
MEITMTIFTHTLPNKTMPDLADYMTVDAAAQKLKFHPETVRRLVRDGILEGQKWSKEWLILKSSVEKYIKQIGDNKHNSRRK